MWGLFFTVASLLAPLSTRATRFSCSSPLEWRDDLHGCYTEGWLPPRHGFTRPILRGDQLRDAGDVVKVSLSQETRLTDALGARDSQSPQGKHCMQRYKGNVHV